MSQANNGGGRDEDRRDSSQNAANKDDDRDGNTAHGNSAGATRRKPAGPCKTATHATKAEGGANGSAKTKKSPAKPSAAGQTGGDAAQGKTQPRRSQSSQAKPKQAKSSAGKSGQVRSSASSSGRAKSAQAKAGSTKSGPAKSGRKTAAARSRAAGSGGAGTGSDSAARKTPARRRDAPTSAAANQPSGIGIEKRGRVLVTGAAGALAQHVIALLKERYDVVGVEFRGLQNEYPDTVDYVVDFNKRPFEDVFREHGFSAIIHLGRIRFTQSTRNRRYSANVVGTARLLNLALKYGVEQVIALSTYHVYGADPRNPSLIDEEYPMRAANLMPEVVDAVELENLFNIHLYKHPELNIHILRPCNIAGPGINNEISRMLSQSLAPCLFGFSPLMQFLHVEDMARAVLAAFEQNRPGVYNVAPDDYVAYQDALQLAGCRRLFLPSVPPGLAKRAVRMLGRHAPPDYLIDFFKYAVIIDGGLFAKTFDFTPQRSIQELLGHYRNAK